LLSVFSKPAFADDFPTRPITLLHGFGAGGNADTMARILGDAMGRKLGQPVIVEPKPGASGMLASEAMTHATPDGYTILMLTAAHATTAGLYKNLKYDPVADFAMLTTIAFFPYVIAVRADYPAKSLADLLEAAKKAPGKITYTSVGVGSVPHLTGELIAADAGVKLTHVPYRGGTATMTDVLGGQVDVLIDTPTVSMPEITAGQARGLAITSKDPWPGIPNIPTVSQTIPGFDVETWIGLVTVKDTPLDIQKRLQKAAVDALSSPDVIKKLEALGVEVRSSTPDAMRSLVQSEIDRWSKVIKAAGIQLQ
jgi:tripartite-type tricarboxylate transporter receptor subunit TctC